MRIRAWLAGIVVSSSMVATARADEFWRAWGDGKAELDGYALREPRYGQVRDGTAVLIFVTEDFSDAARVKADPGKHPPGDVFPVMKLNFVRDFQTGIYDYNVMTSTFLRTEGSPPFSPAKVSLSSQEWCGHVYQQWLARGDRLVGVSHSYFDGEADAQASLPLVAGGILEDALPILVRGLRGDLLAAGETKAAPFLPSSLRARFAHKPQAWGEATLTRSQGAREVASVLGRVRAFTIEVAEKGGDTTTFTVEERAPHRLLAWQSTSGEAGTLLGSARLPYWQLNQPGGEKALGLLGLSPQTPAGARSPPSRR